MASQEEAEASLREWARNNAQRDKIIRQARDAGVPINRIHTITGIARSTIYRLEQENTMTPTTEYGNFITNCPDSGSAGSFADYVTISLGDFSDDYDIDAIVDDYRDAINTELKGTGVTLNGDEFYGPYPREDVDIAAAIEAVDFYEIAEKHDTSES